jgi:hypothetical protein
MSALPLLTACIGSLLFQKIKIKISMPMLPLITAGIRIIIIIIFN